MDKFIITKDQVDEVEYTTAYYGLLSPIDIKKIRSNPYNPQAEREKVLKELCDSCQFSDSEGIPDESCFDCVVGVKWIALRQEGNVEKCDDPD